MPVQINEVIIRAVVDASGKSSASGCEPPGNTDGSGSGMATSENELAAQVIEIIKEKQER